MGGGLRAASWWQLVECCCHATADAQQRTATEGLERVTGAAGLAANAAGLLGRTGTARCSILQRTRLSCCRQLLQLKADWELLGTQVDLTWLLRGQYLYVQDKAGEMRRSGNTKQ
jgi:hypothetical protein